MKLHERIAHLRNQQGFTQQRVADAIGISRGAYANYEVGTREPDAETLSKLADLYQVSTDYLLGRTDDPKGTAGSTSDHSISPEEREFLEWVKEHVTGHFFYDFHESKNKEQYMESLRLIWKLERGRKPGQKQGE